MRRFVLRLIGLTAALVAAVLVWIAATLPPRAERPASAPAPPDLIVGAYHIHSDRSDGTGSVDAIAAAAQRAGLRFIILTDHGDATRAPDPPSYRHGVLCIDAVEISSVAGHLVALNLGGPAPYPLAGEARDVIEDIHRLGGWAVAAHPDSPREALRWHGTMAGVDGVEWFNVDSEWRAHGFATLAPVALRSLFRAPESVATLFQSPARSLARLDALSAARPVFTLAAVDAHARLGQDVEQGSVALQFPGYETMFRVVTQTVKLDRPLTGDARADSVSVLDAIHAGRSFSVVRAFVDTPFALQFQAATASGRVDYGGALAVAPGGATFHAAVPPGRQARLVLMHGGREVASGIDALDFQAGEPGAYRVEARLADRTVPWIVSNAIQIGLGDDASRATAQPEPARRPAAVTPIDPGSWVIEKDPSSTAEIVLSGTEVRLRYRLGPGVPVGQYVALASAASGSTPVERLEFTASSVRPVRVSAQIRLPGGPNGQRWQRSVYIDSDGRRISVPLATLEPVEPRSLRPTAARVQSFLLVIDTLNARPGTSGEVVFRDLAFVAAGQTAPGSSKF
jgi:hypothetical protein